MRFLLLYLSHAIIGGLLEIFYFLINTYSPAKKRTLSAPDGAGAGSGVGAGGTGGGVGRAAGPTPESHLPALVGLTIVQI